MKLHPPWLLALLFLIPSGCAGGSLIEKTVKSQAAVDFPCGAETIQMSNYPYKRGVYTYRAHGCDKTQIYSINCGLFACTARPAEPKFLSRPMDDPKNSVYTEVSGDKAYKE
ncbi:hypothetical protein [Nannocystis sp. SCPEA4]|uniref:hypothetical protein n=1 Tax=Nannocystis sp. SCPEA4 TaxID=2996787 RepID=UPI002271BA12|nr:hypothetical protein [Nannocystis sp. SCPEA4]MCY1058215.1 hypothetical protein [Nannocystis sp. SCPEA4]